MATKSAQRRVAVQWLNSSHTNGLLKLQSASDADWTAIEAAVAGWQNPTPLLPASAPPWPTTAGGQLVDFESAVKYLSLQYAMPIPSMPLSVKGGISFVIVVAVVNRTGFDLTVDDVVTIDGDLDYASDVELTAPPSEIDNGGNASSVGLWRATGHSRNPGIAVKIAASPATGGQPVYVAADVTRGGALGMGSLVYSLAVHNDQDRGGAQNYYDTIIDSGAHVGFSRGQDNHVKACAVMLDAVMIHLNDKSRAVWFVTVDITDSTN